MPPGAAAPTETRVFTKRIELFQLAGIAVRVDLSWLVLAALITWSFASRVLPEASPGLAPAVYWLMGGAAAAGIFASIVVHELAHALVARHYGIPMRGITLFIFGGVAEMTDEPPNAEAELVMALAGPVISVFVAGALGLAWLYGATSGWSPAAIGVVGRLSFLNALLAAFNLIPAFPLDGGRVLRAALWYARRDLRWASKVTSRIGSGFGLFMIVLGVAALAAGSVLAGIWWCLIGLFLHGAARSSHHQLLLRRSLEGERVRRFMQTDPVVVPRAISVEQLVEDYLYRHHHKMFPVVDNERLMGCITTHRLRQLPREEWSRQSVGAVVERCGPDNTVAPESDAMSALSLMNRTGASRLMVADGDRLVGILSLRDLLHFLSLRMDPEGGAGAGRA
jgi:Zn-dependent protease